MKKLIGELEADALAALGAGGSAFIAVSMGFAAFLAATGVVREPGHVRPPSEQETR
ncbi:hypothetical protein GCM10022224_074560 [Nonomuraea antimicrobica]|uniref:Uncharacterized protein n=1 Tax=Nonomuraea antimicrobica TaxID=561173 RepID=A0ABP7D0C9_9ACTN